MSEPKLISPMLDRFAMGDPISSHHGVRCCPAMEKDSDDKYIVKIISIPASQTQLDALLLTGAYADAEAALAYFKDLADGVADEVQILKRLSQLEGFLPYEHWQLVPMEEHTGYDVYLLGSYKRSLERHFTRTPMTHLGAINLGLDLCAALAVCRRAGYLYIDLKPSNVFVTGDNEYRIGDLGFVRLDSLKYASLPDKYRSRYTAPEIPDAFSALNTTIDVYAVGLILYQAYNDGKLPFSGDSAPAEVFPAPMYADYEMTEIILKACAPDPNDRWQDPIQMGQALVSYMQRNGANDTPIVPQAVPAIQEEENDAPESAAEEELQDEVHGTEPAEAVEAETASVNVAEDESEEDAETETIYNEDDFGNLTFLMDAPDDETAPEHDDAAIAYDEVSEEVSDILSQADDLAAHPVPDPVVAPEPIEIPMPEPLPREEVTQPTEDAQEEADAEATECADEAEPLISEEPETAAQDEDADEKAPPAKKKSSGHWVRNSLIILVILALIAGGFYYFNNYYLQSIESIRMEGSEDGLIVYVDTNIDDSKLTVVCSDAYGNQIIAPVVDGKATFTSLVPDTGYNVHVQIQGFHKLTGQTSTAYSTPVQTSIVQFNAATGSEDGSVILGFTVDGPDAQQWSVVYSADGEEEKTVAFPSHMVTLTGLTVGKEYTFRLVPDSELYVTGMDEIKFTASKLIYAENLTITGCMNNSLTATWTAPEGVAVESWTVRCYSNSGYNETVITNKTVAVFDELDHTKSFTVEVTAAGMSVNQRVYVAENSITFTDFQADTSDPQKLALSWKASKDVPADGWILSYKIVGSDIQKTVTCKDNSAVIEPVIPGAVYEFTIQSPDGAEILGLPFTCTVPEAEEFSRTFDGKTTTSKDLAFQLCRFPGWIDWDWFDIRESNYTSTFSVGEKASCIVHVTDANESENEWITLLYVIRDADGTVLEYATQSFTWEDMWYRNYCELDIPCVPDTAGAYKISIYFNGEHAVTQDLTITG